MIEYIFVVLSLVAIYCYVSSLKQKKNPEKNDFLNINLMTLKICGWNILHVVFYFILCVLLKVSSYKGYLLVISIGFIWYVAEIYLFINYNKNYTEDETHDDSYVYSSISHPRYDDIIFNIFGIMLYALYRNSLRR